MTRRLPPPSTPAQLLRLRLTRSALSTTSPLATCPSSRTASTKARAAAITPSPRIQSLLLPPSTATTPTATTTTAFFSRNNLSTTTTVNKRDQTTTTTTLAPSTPVVLRASVTGLGLLFVLGLGLGYGITDFLGQKSTEQQELGYTTIEKNIQDILDDQSSTTNMSGEIAPGRPGNLTPEQEEKLKQLWKLIFQVCGVYSPSESSTPAPEAAAAAATTTSDAASIKGDDKKKKSKLSMFSRKHKKDSDETTTTSDSASTASGSTTPASPAIVLNASTTSGDDDKYNQLSKFHETLASQSPAAIRETIWSMVKHDHPDALVLRFLRARKWDVEKALVMLISTMNWRDNEMKVDTDIMRSGEGGAVEAEKMEAKTSEEVARKKLAIDFLTQTRMGKSYVHGVDKQGRPICYVRVRLHRQGEQSEESLERYTVYLIETCRVLLQGGVDTATIVFDMTGFSMANMDYTPVKFMVKCFEANYPECLGAVLVHKAPWIFQGIWRVIRGWLDPVVANKVHFTNNIAEMSEFISPEKIPKDLDGQESWEYKYVEPIPGENDKMKDAETLDKLQAARAELVREYEEATLQWIQSGNNSEELKKKRDEVAEKLRVDYWNLDPYVRARSFYDRVGVLLPGGKLDPYLEGKKDGGVSGITEGVAKVGVSETQADDVD
ncbi:hypothetical protein B0H65DRAFT_149968 [Neurospora tetraspora]|uniref:CRAL-TRIO domain-containing protein n=1 Tax=Neurospora tetraspora TaxID=94610 RepID=A0AAE0MT53_9PEZI|nr:hypothetical protein B0H65DRAFT_149968 [Neurospora tetraspora]